MLYFSSFQKVFDTRGEKLLSSSTIFDLVKLFLGKNTDIFVVNYTGYYKIIFKNSITFFFYNILKHYCNTLIIIYDF